MLLQKKDLLQFSVGIMICANSGCISIAVGPESNESTLVMPSTLVPPSDSTGVWCREYKDKNSSEVGFISFFECDKPGSTTLIRASKTCRSLGSKTLAEHHARLLSSVTTTVTDSKMVSETVTPYIKTDFESEYESVKVSGTVASLKRGDCVQDLILVSRAAPIEPYRVVFSDYLELLAKSKVPPSSQTTVDKNSHSHSLSAEASQYDRF